VSVAGIQGQNTANLVERALSGRVPRPFPEIVHFSGGAILRSGKKFFFFLKAQAAALITSICGHHSSSPCAITGAHHPGAHHPGTHRPALNRGRTIDWAMG